MFQFRVIQIIRNSFIRLEGFLSGLFSNLFGFLSRLFSVISKVLGFTTSNYFIEFDQAQDRKLDQTKQLSEAEPAANSAPATTRRRPDAKMDYFLNLAQQTKTSK